MKKFTFSFKSLLLAAGLLLGSANAWADTQIVQILSEDYESYAVGDITSTMQTNGWTFQSKNNKNQVTINQGTAPNVNTTKFFNFYYPDGGANRNQRWDFGVVSSLNADNWTLTFSAALNPGVNNSANIFSVTGTSSGNVTHAYNEVTNPFLTLKATAAGSTTYKPTIGATSYDEEYTLANGTWYKFTIRATEIENNTATLYVKVTSYDGETTILEKTVEDLNTSAIGNLRGLCWNSPRGYSNLCLDDVLLTKEVDAATCSEPTSTITGADGTSRKFTLACETPASTIYYSETEKSYGDDGWLVYSSEVTTAAATIYMYAATAVAHSEVTSFATGAGTAVVLNNPVMSNLSLADNGVDFTPTYTFANGDNSGLIGSPSATLTATFNEVALLGFTGTFTPTQDGTLVVTSSADGYTSSQITINCYVRYSQFWQSVDYSTLSEAEMTAYYPTWTKSESGRWASWKETGSNYTYYSVTDGEEGVANFTFDTYFRIRRNVASLVEGFGIGRNNTGGETLTVTDATDNDIVALKIYNGYGNSAAADANYTVYSLRNGANVTYSLSNGKLLMQGAIYRPLATVSATIGSTGWTTFASSYPLDLSSMTASTGEVAAYYASSSDGENVTMVPTDATVAAGEGLMLKGTPEAVITIPVAATGDAIDGNKLVGCPTETVLAANADNYVLVSNAGTAEFQSLEVNGATIPAGKAYLNLTANPVKAFRIAIVDGTATGVEAPVAAEAVEEDGVLYNTSGQQVTADYKGIVIKNGKKYFNK